jgi:hypothetical protein
VPAPWSRLARPAPSPRHTSPGTAATIFATTYPTTQTAAHECFWPILPGPKRSPRGEPWRTAVCLGLPPETNKRGRGSRNGPASGATKSWALSIRCTKASHNAQLARSMVPGFSTPTSAPTHAGGSARTHTPHAGGRQYQYTPHSRPPPPNTLHRATPNTQLPATTGQPVARRHLANRLRQPTVGSTSLCF